MASIYNIPKLLLSNPGFSKVGSNSSV